MSFDGLNRLDAWGRGARWQHTARAAAMSTIATAVAAAGPSALPYVTSLFTSTSLGKEDVTESLMMVEAITAEMAVNGVVKSLAGRERPEAHLIFAPGMSLPRDANGSFYSGHSGTAFAGLFAYARVRQMHGKSPGRFWWLVALPAAAVTPYLRVAADKHYLTDVLSGAAVGGATGWLAPPLLHPRLFKSVTISPTVDQSGGKGVVSILAW
jgi:membrane-associated phospholipid phosphatase